MYRHDVTEGTRELIKDTTADIKGLSQYPTTDPKKTVSYLPFSLKKKYHSSPSFLASKKT